MKSVTRYALVPGLLVLLLTVLLMAASHQVAVEQLSARARFRVQQQAQMLAVQYDGALRSAQRDVRLLARSPLLRPGRPIDRLRAELEFLRSQPGAFVWLGLVALDGTVLAGTQGWLEGRSIASRPVFQHGIVGSFVSDVHAPAALKPLMIDAGMPVQELLDIGEPVRDKQGRTVAMLAAHLGVDWVGRMRDHAFGHADDPHVMRPRVQVIGADGQRSVIPEEGTGSDWKGSRRQDDPASADESAYFIAQAQVSQLGQPPVLPWSVRALQARDQALAPAYRMLGTMALVGALAAAVVATLGAWLARRVWRPWGPLFDAVLSRIDGQADARSEERLRLALAAASLGTWDLTVGDGPAQIRWSPGYAEALGIPAALLPADARQLFDRIHPDDRQAVRDAVDLTLQKGRPLAVEFRVIVGDRIKWHAVHGAVVPAPDGLGMRLMGVGRDVTQRHEHEAALQDSRARLSAIVAGATDAIVSTDEHGRITLFNPAAERVFGHEGAVMLGQPLDRLLPPGVRDVHALHMTTFQNSGEHRRMLGLGQVQGVAADGRLIELEASVSMAEVNGQRVLTAILRDVTERMRQQQELEAARADLAQLTRRLLVQEKQTGRQLAQALHDALGQTLTALQLHWDALVRASQEQRAPLQDRVAMLVTTANQQMRGVLGELRPPMLDEFGLVAALDNELQRQRPVKAVPSLHLLAVPRLNAQRWRGDVEYAAFMVGREALANALHHANARAIVLTLDGDEGELLLRVQDDGVGLDPALLAQAARPGRLGLVGMRERALAIGARLRIEAPASGGTIVTLYWSTNDEDLPGR